MALPDNIPLTLELKGVDNASQPIDEARQSVQKYGDDAEKAGNASEDAARKSTASWTEFRSMYTTVVEVLRIGKQVFDEIVGSTLELSNTVRQFRDVTGQSAEESSRLVQVLDDYKVNVTAAEMATKKLAKDGLEFNIDTLARLSDEYLALNSNAERTQFLYDKFGKSGTDFAEIMLQGGDAIREANAAISENLILTDEALRQSREYEKNVDNLNDSLLAMKVTIGNNLLPAINDLFDAHEMENEAMRRLGIEYGDFISESDRLAIAQEKEKIALEEVSAARMEGLASLYETKDATIEVAEVTEDLTKKNEEFLGLLENIQSAEERYNDKVTSLTADRMKLEEEKQKLLEQGYSEESEKIQDINEKLQENSDAAKKNADEHDLANRRIILGLLERKLTQDGILTDDELNWLLEKGQAWGIYSQTVIDETRAAMSEVNALIGTINAIPKHKTFTLTINTIGSIPSGVLAQTDQIKQTNKQGRAGGGAVSAGKMYEVNELGMPELLTFGGKQMLMMPNSGSGYVTPLGNSGGGVATSGGVVVQIMLDSATPDPERVAYNLKPAVERVVRDLRQQGKL